MLTLALDDLRPHTSAVSKCAWNALLRNPGMINQVEQDTEDAMTMVGAPCLVLLTPQPETGTLGVDYQWLSEAGPGDNMREFLRLTLIDCLLEKAGVAVADGVPISSAIARQS